MIWYPAIVCSVIHWASAGALVCTGNEFRCDADGPCVSRRRLCDGAADCADGSDEVCAGRAAVCRPGQTACRDRRVCVHVDWLCDGVPDCPDGSDEAACVLLQRRRCGPGQLQCRGDAECLDVVYRCDGEPHCDDGSDEIGCAGPESPCGDEGFWCPHRGFCVGADRQCDGVDDCGDGSDELYCDVKSCEPDELRCGALCVRPSWVCDGTTDCEDGRDEVNCSAPAGCPPDHFACPDGLCVPEEDRCDGHQDCGAGEDELDCEAECEHPRFRCPDGSCLPQEQVCDGFRQCARGEDERKCALLAHCPASARCQQLCLAQPLEATPNCTCRRGFALQPDGFSCADVDECSTLRPCSHGCRNVVGSFNCSCADGYQLHPDGVTCVAGPPPASLVMAVRHAIEQVTLTGASSDTAHKGLANAVYVDYHLARGLLFWLDTAQNIIYRSLITGSRPSAVVVAGLFQPAGLAVDWLHDLLYWADERRGSLQVSALDGAGRHRLLAGDLHEPRAICVHPQRALLFWADIGVSAKIERADGDGGNRRVIVTGRLAWPNGLTLDYPTDTVYWADAKLNTIGASRLDGTDRRVVLSRGVPHPFGLTLFEDSLYWTDWKTHALHQADKRHGEGVRQLLVNLEHPMDVRSVHPLRQPGASTRCRDNGRCSHLCLPRPEGRRCACPSGLQLLPGSSTSCQLVPPAGLVVARNGSLHVTPLSGGAAHLVPLVAAGRPTAVAADADDVLYWADADGGTLQRALWNGSRHRTVVDWDVGNVTALAVDWVGGLLYWTDAGLQRLEVARTDGRHRLLLLADGLDRPAALVVDPPAGLMFWSDLGAADGRPARIERAAMNGSGRKAVVSSDLAAPAGLALDADSRTIYWTDSKLGTVSAAPLTDAGVGRARLLFSGRPGPQALAVAAGRLYWVEAGAGGVLNASAAGGPPPGRPADAEPALALAVLGSGRPLQPALLDQSGCGHNNGGCSHLCLLVPAGPPTCHCPTGVPLSGDGQTCEPGPDLSLVYDRGWEVRRLALTNPPSVDTVLPLPPRMHVTALAWDPHSRRLLYADAGGGRRRIVSTTDDGLQSHPVVTHELADVADMTVDVVDSKLYWTDMSRGSVEVAELDGSLRQLLVRGLRMPRALAVLHSGGLLFWADWGGEPRIEKAWMDGTHRSVIVSERLGRPSSVAVDGPGRKLYWCDNKLGVIEWADFDGKDRAALVSGLHRPFGLAVHRARMYWTEWEPAGAVRSRAVADRLSLPETLVQGRDNIGRLLVVERDAAVLRYACGDDNGGCAGLCLRRPGGQACRCGTGLVPAADGISCPARPSRMLLYLTLNSVARISLDTEERWEVTMPVTGVHNAVHLDFIEADNGVVFADRGLNEIRWADLRTPPAAAPRTLLSAADVWPEGVAVDWAARLVFFSDARAPALAVLSLSGCCRRRLVREAVSRPGAVAVLPPAGLLFWADLGAERAAAPRLEAARLDGSERRILVEDDLDAPAGLAVERDRLYWADPVLHRLESCNLDGTDRRVLVDDAPHPFGVTVLGDWLYWSDWETQSVHQARKLDGGARSVVRDKLERIMGVVAAAAERQQGSTPCSADNGGCSHLCLHRGGGRHVCACPDVPDQRPCHTQPRSADQAVVSGSSSSLTTALLTSGGLLLLLLIVLMLGLLRRSRLAQRQPGQEATLTFSNPTYNSSASDFSNDKRLSWRKAKYDKAQDAVQAGPAGGGGAGGGLEAAALIDGVIVDLNSSTPPASSPGVQH